jgi:hypothetical protein
VNRAVPMSDWESTTVRCYAGYRADERPVSFTVHDSSVGVLSIVDSWNEPHYRYFKVQANDGGTYLLQHQQHGDRWQVKLLERQGPAR